MKIPISDRSAVTQERFKVIRGKSTVVVTVLYFMVLAGFAALGMGHVDEQLYLAWYIVMAGMAGAAIYAFSNAPRYIELSGDAVTIKKTIGSKRLPMADITEIRPQPLPPGNGARIFGISSAFATIGWYYSRDIGMYFAYLGEPHHAVCITMRSGRKYVVNCDDSERLVSRVREFIEG